jgi:acyl-CoA synthetase (NDP forming)
VLASIVAADGAPAQLVGGSRPVATFAYPESAARALGRAAERAEWLRRPAGRVPELEGIDLARARTVVDAALARSDDRWLEPDEARTLLEAYRIPLAGQREAADPDEAVAAAHELGLPVAVKTAAAGAHKSETGGVALDLATETAVRAAAERIGGRVIVQEMVREGAELLAGIVQDPVFGPLVAFGPGGVLAELIGEAQFRIAPVTDVDALELVRSGKAGRLVAGFRGSPPADAEALADLVLRLAQLGTDLPEVAELDLNPVLALPGRAVAVDARVRVRRTAAAARAKTW